MTEPTLSRRPGARGITMAIDPGLPTGAFIDAVSSHRDLIDLVKFGWGTALVTRDLGTKVSVLADLGIGFYFGGTLFEHHVWTGRFDAFLDLVHRAGTRWVEVSNGTIPLDQRAKAGYVRRLSDMGFTVLSEVGFKDPDRSARLTPADWVGAIREDLDAGAAMVITETRESGRSGIARPDGHLRGDVVAAILDAVDAARLLFEAPTKDLQVELLRLVGREVNLGNIALADVVGVETLRRGLRADTLLDFASPAADTAAHADLRPADAHVMPAA